MDSRLRWKISIVRADTFLLTDEKYYKYIYQLEYKHAKRVWNGKKRFSDVIVRKKQAIAQRLFSLG
jgi:hypothetical protein